ncbi:MAG TPA: nucleoside deaminase [Candidatus Megaira endosymbiont of Nemacystus decipiens]|nr:nucleoside deaminase [Candidatus Megaera endosymbiont of Nemacystus decipiens]
MNVALNEAKKAYNKNEVPVGCVIVNKSGFLLTKKHNLMQGRLNPNDHAEMLAISAACKELKSKNLSDCDLYVTLEPCTMCASAISNARIRRLYYGASDSKQGAIENGVRFFTSSNSMHKPEIYSGIREVESIQLMQKFFHNLRRLSS